MSTGSRSSVSSLGVSSIGSAYQTRQGYTFGQVFLVFHCDDVMTELAWSFNLLIPLNCDTLKKRMSRSITQTIGMTKDVKPSASHKPTAGRAIQIPHPL